MAWSISFKNFKILTKMTSNGFPTPKYSNNKSREKCFDIETEMLGSESGMKQEVGFLKGRWIAWTPDGITYESDSKHVNIILSDLGMEDCKPVGTPMSPEDLKEAAAVIDEHGENDEGEYMDAASAFTY